jgi:hypothetical protein
MKEQFVSYEIAVKLKELGFDEKCIAYYGNIYGEIELLSEFVLDHSRMVSSVQSDNETSAPLWQQVIDWLRITHGVHIEISRASNIHNELGYKYHTRSSIKQYDNLINFNSKIGVIFTYEQAREQAIFKAMQLIKQRSLS